MKRCFKVIIVVLFGFSYVSTVLAEDGVWTQKADFGGGAGREQAVGFSIGSNGYIGTGSNLKEFWEYNPATNIWTQKADFGGVGRYHAVGFSIGSKGYIGTGDNGDGASPSLIYKDFWEYDPATNIWTQKADFGGGLRSKAVGFPIGNKGYIGTGKEDWAYKRDFWEYDPSTDTWTQKADFGGTARYDAVGFSIGNKGYIGTGFDNLLGGREFWEYDPSTDNWTQKADFGGTAEIDAVGFSIGNKGYVGTGLFSSKDFWEYDPWTDTWTQKSDFGGGNRIGAVGFSIGNKGYIGTGGGADFWEYDPMSLNPWIQMADFVGPSRHSAAGFSIGDKGYIGTGVNGGTCTRDFWEYNSIADTWTQKADFGGGCRYCAIGFSIGSKGYLGTGSDDALPYNNMYKDFWEYDPAGNTWTRKADFGGIGRGCFAGFSIGGKGYIGTGLDYDYVYKDFWEYDPYADTWSRKADFAGTGRGGAVGFSIGSKGYIGTGEDVSSFTKDFWEYYPATDTWTQKADFGGTARAGAVGFSIGGKGYIGTGTEPSGLCGAYTKDLWAYDAIADAWGRKIDFQGGERSGAFGFSIGSKGYLGTGDAQYPTNPNAFWGYDPDVGLPTLTIIKSGNGTVTSLPSGIHCGADCNEGFTEGESVTLTAQPDPGSVFSGWFGPCSGTGTCVVTMNQDQFVRVVFTKMNTLSVSKLGTGSGKITSSPSGIYCGVDCTETYNYGTAITLTAIPDTESDFTSWTGCDSASDNTCTVTITADKTATATFQARLRLLSPNGGESWAAGSTRTIQWSYGANAGSFVKIELLKGGVLTTTISYYTSIGSAGSGSFNWSIPSNQVSGSDYQIRVTSTTNAAYSDISNSTFTIVGPPPPTISVTSPNGGEALTAGSAYTVRWNYTGNAGSAVKIELLKGGILSATISYYTSIGSAGSGSYNWSIPSTQVSGSDYQIKVTSTTNAAYSDISDSTFTIAAAQPPTISVTSPNGGESLMAGSAYTIRWNYTGNPGSAVKIELLKGGVLTTTISYYTSIGSAGSGSFNWSIPSNQVSGSDYQIRVTSTTNAAYSDISNSTFTIVGPPPPTISVTSPNGGETLTAGSAQTIRWNYTGNPGSAVKIELLKGGVPTTTISYYTSIGSSGSGSFNWSIPSNQVSGSDYQIKVTSTTNAAYSDISDSVFTIVGPPPPTISVTSPNGGESLTAGSVYTVRWTYGGNPGSAVKIELLKGGILTATLSYYISIGSAGSGSFNWSIPSNQVSGSDYQIKVTSTTNAAYSDTSDSNFTIVGPPPPTISVTSPNGGEMFTTGSMQTIRWTYTGNPGSAVKIELLKGGVLSTTVSYSTWIGNSGSGSFNWWVPSNQAAGNDYQIKVTGTTNSAYTDTSDSNFTIGN